MKPLHPHIKKAIDTFKQIQNMSEKEETELEALGFIDLTPDEEREINKLDDLSSNLQRQTV